MKKIYMWVVIALLFACSRPIQVTRILDKTPEIFPDYKEVVVPPNIAPLNFMLKGSPAESRALISYRDWQLEAKGCQGRFEFSPAKWKLLLEEAKGNDVQVTVQVKEGEEWIAYAPFSIRIASEKIDSYLAYRLIDPGYELWNKMGIYQRDLTDFTQTTIVENKQSGNNCMNCHSFCMQNPDKMLFHMRATYPGTILVDGDRIEKLNTKTPETRFSLVYPSWHPSGKYVAFSVNDTKQAFHLNDKNRIEVYDVESDVVVYDVERHEIVTTAPLFSKTNFETFPTFTPDGKRLYFCTAAAQSMPVEYDQVKYHLCSIAFNPDTRTFGSKVDTLYHVGSRGLSASFPRVSPDGRFLLYTLSGYGNFSIWHKDADLYLADLVTGESRPLVEVNSEDVDSYHSWSSNSRWFVFSSRRVDGLYTHPYIAYVDSSGKIGKPFLVPQKSADFYLTFMKSFNIPEFITGKVNVRGHSLATKAKEDKGVNVRFVAE